MKHLFTNHDLMTSRCGEMIDVTDDVLSLVRESGVANGLAVVYSPHATCAIVLNEFEDGFLADFADALVELAPELRYYWHDDLTIRTRGIEPDTSEFPNGHSHIRSELLSSPSLTIPVVDG